MKKIYLVLFVLMCFVINTNAQSIDELKAKKAELAAKAAEAQATADALNGEIGGLQKEIDILSGWMKGISGNLGFNFNSLNSWAAAANPNSSSSGVGLGLTAFANKITEKTLWRNKGIVSEAWQKVNISGADNPNEKSLLDSDNQTADILNLSSLYGYRVHPKIAISALGELNTSVFSFLEPGTLDIGAGVTWTPSNNLVVVVHPLNYHIAWPVGGGVDAVGAIGAKLRADYTNTYNIGGKAIGLSSTFTSFLPYSDKQTTLTNDAGESWEAGLFEYTWLNTISFNLWKGIGVGIGVGFRGADFEINETTQNYYNLGLSYNI